MEGDQSGTLRLQLNAATHPHNIHPIRDVCKRSDWTPRSFVGHKCLDMPYKSDDDIKRDEERQQEGSDQHEPVDRR